MCQSPGLRAGLQREPGGGECGRVRIGGSRQTQYRRCDTGE